MGCGRRWPTGGREKNGLFNLSREWWYDRRPVVVMENGRHLVAGTPDDLTRRFWPGTVLLVESVIEGALAGAGTIPGVTTVEPDTDPRRLRLHLDGDARIPEVIEALVQSGVRLRRAEPIEPSLEDLYFAVRTKSSIAAQWPASCTA